jgi:hypothetical protein
VGRYWARRFAADMKRYGSPSFTVREVVVEGPKPGPGLAPA